MARSIECKCEYNFTCGYCLCNAKPYFHTLSDGSGIAEIPVQRYTKEAREETAQTDELLHRLYRIMGHIQSRPFEWGNDQLSALRIVLVSAEDVSGGYYRLCDWAKKNLTPQ